MNISKGSKNDLVFLKSDFLPKIWQKFLKKNIKKSSIRKIFFVISRVFQHIARFFLGKFCNIFEKEKI